MEYLYANLCECFEAKMKRMVRINGFCEYTETCEYEANKIQICFEANTKKLRIRRILLLSIIVTFLAAGGGGGIAGF
jgi:hypothetical protein